MKRWLLICLGVACAGAVAVAVVLAARHLSAGLIARELAAARAAQSTGDDRTAAAHFDRYLHFAGAAADPDMLVERALVALRIGSMPDVARTDVEWALNAAFEAVRRRPANIPLRRRLADLQIAQQDFAGAREHLLVVRESIDAGQADDDPAAVDLCLARTWSGSGDHPRALALLAKLTGFDVEKRSFGKLPPGPAPGSAAYLLLAELLRDRFEDPAAAHAAIARCVRVHPDDPAALIAYSRSMLARKDPEAALQAAAHAVALAPDDPVAVRAHADSLAATGDNKAACEAFIEGVRRIPKSQPLFAYAVYHLVWYGTPEQTLEILDQCWERLPFNEYAVLLFITNMRIDWNSRPEIARRLDDARAKFGPDNLAVIALEARMRETLGNWSAAEKALVKARSIVPTDAKSRIDSMLAKCLAMLDEQDAAISVYRRLEVEPTTWWQATAGIAEAHLDLGQADLAGDFADRLLRNWDQARMADAAGATTWMIVPTLSTMIRVIAAQPASRRDWTVLEAMVEAMSAAPHGAADARVTNALGELRAAAGDADAALAALPPDDEKAPTPLFDPLRVSLVAKREGIEAMRTALEALPQWRRCRAEVLAAAARSEVHRASGDARGWLRDSAAASDGIRSADEAVQLLQELAGLAREAGWTDEARALWQRAASRLPEDFRPHLALALDAARRGDADAAAGAAARVVSTEGSASPRGRVASAAALVAAVRQARGGRPGTAEDFRDKRLQEAKSLLQQAGSDRKNWQAVAVLQAEVESLAGRPAVAAGHLRRAIDCGPRDPRLVLDLAAILDRGLLRADAQVLRDTVAPDGVGGNDRLAIDAHLAVGDLRPAAERALLAVDEGRADLPQLVWLSRLCSRAGLQERARELATGATRIDPQSADGWLRLIECQLEDGDADAADAALAAGCAASAPEQRSLLRARGDAIFGRIAEAERGFREALQESGDSAAAAAFLVEFLLQQGRDKDAETALQEVLSSRWGRRPVQQQWARDRMGTLRVGAARQ